MRGVTELKTYLADIYEFLLTHPMRGVTLTPAFPVLSRAFLLTHPMRGVTQALLCRYLTHNFYSHTPCGV